MLCSIVFSLFLQLSQTKSINGPEMKLKSYRIQSSQIIYNFPRGETGMLQNLKYFLDSNQKSLRVKKSLYWLLIIQANIKDVTLLPGSSVSEQSPQISRIIKNLAPLHLSEIYSCFCNTQFLPHTSHFKLGSSNSRHTVQQQFQTPKTHIFRNSRPLQKKHRK